MRNLMAWLGTGGGLFAAVVPHCPFCAAASGTLLSSLGFGVLATSGVGRWLVPFFLVAGLVGLSIGARVHRAWWVVVLGAVGSVAAYVGWNTEHQPVVVAGAVAVLVAAVLNYMLQRRTAQAARIATGAQ